MAAVGVAAVGVAAVGVAAVGVAAIVAGLVATVTVVAIREGAGCAMDRCRLTGHTIDRC